MFKLEENETIETVWGEQEGKHTVPVIWVIVRCGPKFRQVAIQRADFTEELMGMFDFSALANSQMILGVKNALELQRRKA